MNKTKIEYMDFSWNPLAMRCTPVSAGCKNCWHLVMADRLAGNQKLSDEVRAAYSGDGSPVLLKHKLDAPLRRKKPSVIGVQFMGDLFNNRISDFIISEIFTVMARAKKHTFLVLTKRVARMKKWMIRTGEIAKFTWPPNNVWLGISVENQEAADERIPLLLQTPAAIRFVSCEPLLGPIDNLGQALGSIYEYPGNEERKQISWVIVGGESGPKARPMHPGWARSIRDQCVENSVPLHFKQWGEWLPFGQGIEESPSTKRVWLDIRGQSNPTYSAMMHSPSVLFRVGKKRAGRLLDGREWNEFPETALPEA